MLYKLIYKQNGGYLDMTQLKKVAYKENMEAIFDETISKKTLYRY